MKKTFTIAGITSLLVSSVLLLSACSQPSKNQTSTAIDDTAPLLLIEPQRLDIYHPVPLTADLSDLSKNQKAMLALLIDASVIMDDLFWQQAFSDNKDSFLAQLTDPKVRLFATINYGPWDRLNGDKPFLSGFGEKSPGAEFYPENMTKTEFNSSTVSDKTGLYSVIERDASGALIRIPYSEKYQAQLQKAASILRKAAKLADNKEFANYLSIRADALLSDDYLASDMAWMDMKTNPIELVIGPIETYEDQLFGYRAAFESYVLLKDMNWSDKLAKYAQFLPELQKGLPVAEQYKAEVPGSDADLNAYDVLYYAGHSNAGSKTIAINLPNDERVQLEKGTRRLQLKNAMRAKFDHILVPIADTLITPEQREHITFDAFFANTMFHEVAHGLGIKTQLREIHW